MPKPLFYIGTAFCFFLALTTAAAVGEQLRGGPAVFVALQGSTASTTAVAGWAIVVALLAGLAAAAILLRMAALLAARHLFGAFLALFAVCAAVVSLAWILLLQARMVALLHRRLAVSGDLAEMHFAGIMMLGYFLALSFLALRPYFHIQASRFLSALVLLPLPLFLLILIQEIFVAPSAAPLPAGTPAWLVFFSVVSLLFFAIAVHCIRHRHMFIETTNLRELLEPRVDPGRTDSRPIGGVAFDS
jgi:hypothetical protein